MANFPTSKDDATSLPNPTGTSTQNNPDHGALHTAENAAIIAVEGKVGTGASVPASNTLLIGTGAGTSNWSGLTSSQLAAILSDETGTGSAVFSNTPVLITPKVDTIQENTPGNGVTVGGVNLKAGVVTGTLGSNNAVATANITDNAVTGSKLAANAVTLSVVNSSTSQGSISTSDVILTGLSTSVTWPAGSRRGRVEVFLPWLSSTIACHATLSIYASATVTGSAVQTGVTLIATASTKTTCALVYEFTPAPGAASYCAAVNVDSGVGSTTLLATRQAYLTVRVM